MKSHLRLAGALAALVSSALSAAGQNRTFTNQYSFGDSLTDNGNARAASGGTVNASAPYFGGRWSNGPVFAELLGNTLAIGATAPASVKSSMGFGFGGATAVPGVGTAQVPPIAGQLQLFQSHAVAVQRTDLFTLWIGANDLLNTAGLASTRANPAAMNVAGINAAQVAATSVQSLIGFGAKNIVVLNMPDIGATPAGIASGGGSLLTAGSQAYNTEFDARLAAVAGAATDVTLIRIDTAAILSRVGQDYRALGFSNASSGFTLPAAAGGAGGTGDGNAFVYFDGLHPSAKTHAILAAVITEALNPEPVIGFAATEGTAALALRALAARSLAHRLRDLAGSTRPVGRADGYVSFDYGNGDRVASGVRPKFSYDAQLLTAGLDWRVSDGFTAGAALETGRLVAKVAAGGGDFTLENQGGKLYGEWHGGPVALAIDAGYGVIRLKGAHRTTALGGFQTNARSSGSHWGAGARVSWILDSTARFRPWIELRTERVKLDAHTERDLPALGMEFARQEAKSSLGGIGIEAGTDTSLAGRNLRLDGAVGWHGELGAKNRNVAGKLANNFTRPTVVGVKDGNGSGFEVSGTATLALSKRWQGSLTYAAEIRSDDKLANRVALALQTGF